MKKKILIGSIIAVAIIILVSFTSVVGYRSVKSDSKIDSPLFSIRNKKGEISSNFIGKGKAINIPLHRKNDKAELVEKIVNRIKMMNEKSLERVTDIIFYKLESDEKIVHTNRNDIKDAIYFISENPELSKSFILQDKEETGFKDYTYGNQTRIGCILVSIYTLFILLFLAFVLIFFMEPIPTNDGCYV